MISFDKIHRADKIVRTIQSTGVTPQRSNRPDPMTVYAHTREGLSPSTWEPLSDHLKKVSQTSAEFAAAFEAAGWADALGQCHDLGKLSDDFQNYLLKAGTKSEDAGVEEEFETQGGGMRVDHSTYGARFVASSIPGPAGQILAFCIAGHHTGLPDETSDEDLGGRSTLRYKLDSARYSIPPVEPPEIELSKPTLHLKLKGRAEKPFQLEFFTRMLFSCLIDADRRRTEEFCSPDVAEERSGLSTLAGRPSLAELKSQLDISLREMQEKADPTEVNRQRTTVLNHCRDAANLPPGFFSLNVPTGGGKTLSSLEGVMDFVPS